MCTLSFIPKENGFLVGMNRDESRAREKALPPHAFVKDGVQTLYPREARGGTWIACNSCGVLLALLNWYSVENKPTAANIRSRGTIIPELIGEKDSSGVRRAIGRLDLRELRPFRLVGVLGKEKTTLEWRWDGVRLETLETEWAAKHWFSSSLSDRSAEQGRGATCKRAWKVPGAGSEEWLRALHRSHVPEPGPFSVCVHRPDAATVSYTEVRCNDTLVAMDYVAGNPCLKPGFAKTASLTLATSQRG